MDETDGVGWACTSQECPLGKAYGSLHGCWRLHLVLFFLLYGSAVTTYLFKLLLPTSVGWRLVDGEKNVSVFAVVWAEASDIVMPFGSAATPVCTTICVYAFGSI